MNKDYVLEREGIFKSHSPGAWGLNPNYNYMLLYISEWSVSTQEPELRGNYELYYTVPCFI